MTEFSTLTITIIVTAVYCLGGLGNAWASEEAPKALAVGENTFYLDDTITQATKRSLNQDLDQLMADRSGDFDGVDLLALRERIETLAVAGVDGPPLVGSGYRNGAVNMADLHVMFFNHKKLKTYNERQKSILRWHEALGAMGYTDENYFLSASIAIKVTTPEVRLHPRFRERLRSQFNLPLKKDEPEFRLAAGGATGVGSGGDGVCAEVRWALIAYMNLLASAGSFGDAEQTKSLINLAIDTPIEPVEFVRFYRNLIRYQDLSIGVNQFNLKIAILIDDAFFLPSSGVMQKQVDTKQTKRLNQIIDVLRALLPDSGGR
jgi:hypothetical protein